MTIRALKSLIFNSQITTLALNINKLLLVIVVINIKKIIKMYKRTKIKIKSSKLKNKRWIINFLAKCK